MRKRAIPSPAKTYDTVDHAGGEIVEYDKTPIPRFLLWLYALLPLVGIAWMVLNWKGSHPWFDQGHWFHLQQAANTTTPYQPVTDKQ